MLAILGTVMTDIERATSIDRGWFYAAGLVLTAAGYWIIRWRATRSRPE